MRLFTFIGISILFTLFNYVYAGVYDPIQFSDEAEGIVKNVVTADKTSDFDKFSEADLEKLSKAIYLFKTDAKNKLSKLSEVDGYTKGLESVRSGDSLTDSKHEDLKSIIMATFTDLNSQEMQDYGKLREEAGKDNPDVEKLCALGQESSVKVTQDILESKIKEPKKTVNDIFYASPRILQLIVSLATSKGETKTDSNSGSE